MSQPFPEKSASFEGSAELNPYSHGNSTGEFQNQPMVGQAWQVNPNQGDATGGLIPYKNPKALIAYYLGIVALFPIIGIPFGIASFVLGILGLKARKANPVIKGSVHAWIGIVLGAFSVVLYGLMVVGMITAMVASRR